MAYYRLEWSSWNLLHNFGSFTDAMSEGFSSGPSHEKSFHVHLILLIKNFYHSFDDEDGCAQINRRLTKKQTFLSFFFGPLKLDLDYNFKGFFLKTFLMLEKCSDIGRLTVVRVWCHFRVEGLKRSLMDRRALLLSKYSHIWLQTLEKNFT